MESNQRFLKEKLQFLGILKEAVKITFKNPKFLIFTCLCSLPLILSSFMYENMYMQTLIEVAAVLQQEKASAKSCSKYSFCFSWQAVKVVDHLIGKVSHNFFLLILSHLGIIHLCDFLTTVATVNSASVICTGDLTFTLDKMFTKYVIDSRLKGPLITSIYTLLMTSLLSVGLFSLLVYIYVVTMAFAPLIMLLFLAMFVAFLRQYVEWSAVWDMATLISILEEKEGDVALVIAAHVTKVNRGSGTLLMIGCLLWRLSLRFVCLFIVLNVGGGKMLTLVAQTSLVCLANIIKWVFFVVYYFDCKIIRRSEKEVHAEEGQVVSHV